MSFDAQGVSRGTVELPAGLFDAQVHEHLLYQSAKTFLANQRQGTSKVKNRHEVTGGGKKPWRQKGTGRARSGSNTSPLWPGGGRAFGPEPRDYRTEMPRRQRRQALVAALSLKASEDAVRVVEGLSFAAPKTREMAAVLNRLGLAGRRTLLVLDRPDANLLLACRNLRGLRTCLAHQLNPYDLVAAEAVVLTAGGLDRVREVFVS
jgi:large subunit ribosomal protein L4